MALIGSRPPEPILGSHKPAAGRHGPGRASPRRSEPSIAARQRVAIARIFGAGGRPAPIALDRVEDGGLPKLPGAQGGHPWPDRGAHAEGVESRGKRGRRPLELQPDPGFAAATGLSKAIPEPTAGAAADARLGPSPAALVTGARVGQVRERRHLAMAARGTLGLLCLAAGLALAGMLVCAFL